MVKSQAVPNMVRDPALLAGMMKVPREEFVAPSHRELAYMDTPVPWNDSGRRSLTPVQTGWLIDALGVTNGKRVLVIGAGSGYEAALLGTMGAQVHALESDPALAERGASLTDREQVAWKVGPLADGWPDGEKFDAILLCGAVPAIPYHLLGQLRPDGVLAGIVGNSDDVAMNAKRIHGGSFRQEPLFDTLAPLLPGFEAGEAFRL
ncbi:MAG: protein-L-isoaspartate O-methyltransferase [Magnetococcales bacterium]|nr:protein-L-isoaspartate O-methyltransferase [Magnetococcales bacterium]